MKIKNLFLAIYDQLTRKGAWRNIFVTHNAFGIFSRYSHTARGSGKQKMSYPTKTVALKAAKAMSEKHGVHFSVYKCAWCDGWHVGKNAQNKVVHENKSEANNLSVVNKPNALYEALKRYPIVDLAPVYDKGVRGRTMSGRGSNWLLAKVHDAGVKVIIDPIPTATTAMWQRQDLNTTACPSIARIRMYTRLLVRFRCCSN